MKPLNVVSIDWDYLVNASEEERLEMFPDGGNENLPRFVLDMIWMSRYAQHEELSKISVDELALETVQSFVNSHKTLRTRCLITDSHKHLYEMVSKSLKKGQPLNIINIDYHHDCYGSAQLPEVDCGNWMIQMVENRHNKLVSPQEVSYTWVKRNDSDCGEFSNRFDWGKSVSIDFLKSIEGFTIDLLFICRSGVWSPPHLDEAFVQMTKTLVADLSHCQFESGIEETRYTEQFVKNYEIEFEFLKSIIN